MTSLRELVTDRRAELGLSLRKVAERSGGLVGHATLNNIELGRASRDLEDSTLRGIALGLDLPLTKVREAAGSVQANREFRLPSRANKLSDSQRRAIVHMVDVLLEKERP